MKQGIFTIRENKKLAEGIYRMKLAGDVSEISTPGQFVNIKLDGHFLRRPISVCDVELDTAICSIRTSGKASEGLTSRGGRSASEEKPGVLTIIYKLLGQGTEEMSEYKEGRQLDVLTGLGNGYDLCKSGDRPLLIGGGVGIPPMYLAAKRLIAEGKQVTVILGFNTQRDVFYIGEFKALGCEVLTASADGSCGVKGFVTDALAAAEAKGLEYSYFYTCGPEAMLKAVYQATKTSGQLSFEERMGCGFGACMGCSCRTVTGYKRICKDGPVLEKEELLW